MVKLTEEFLRQLPKLTPEEENDCISVEELEQETLEELEEILKEIDEEYDSEDHGSKE